MNGIVTVINDIGTVADAITNLIPKLLALGAGLSGICAAVTAAWPKPTEGSRLAKVHALVSKCGFNVGHATNAE